MSKGHEFIACCPNKWGSGKTLGEAVRNMLRVGGTREKYVVKKIPSYAENPWVDDFGQFRADIKEGCEKPDTEENWETVLTTEDGTDYDPEFYIFKYGRLTHEEMYEVIDPLQELLETTDNPELVQSVLMMLGDWALGFNLEGDASFSNRNPSREQAKVAKVLLNASAELSHLAFVEQDFE